MAMRHTGSDHASLPVEPAPNGPPHPAPGRGLEHGQAHRHGQGRVQGRGSGWAKSGGWLGAAAVYGGAALLGAYLYQKRSRSQAEETHPPTGRFLDVEGTTLHYVDIGEGPAVVFIHGSGTTLEDWFLSGVLDHLITGHRLIVVDRPGYGYSERPAGVRWSPERQGRAIAHLMSRLGAEGATLVAHGDGVLPALSIAVHEPRRAGALVLLSGLYFPDGIGPESAAVRMPEVPLVGPLARVTVSPMLARSALPAVTRAAFSPQPVPQRYIDSFPAGLVTRPSQLDASAEDGRFVERATARLSRAYGRITVPVTVIAGTGDGIADPALNARRLAATIGHARLILVPAAGHMVHHSAPARIAAAVVESFAAPAATRPSRGTEVRPRALVDPATPIEPASSRAAAQQAAAAPADPARADPAPQAPSNDTGPTTTTSAADPAPKVATQKAEAASPAVRSPSPGARTGSAQREKPGPRSKPARPKSSAKSGTAKSGSGRSGSAKSGSVKSGSVKSGASRSGAAKSGSGRSGTAKSGAAGTGGSNARDTSSGGAKDGASKQGGAKVGPASSIPEA
ncbi:alpha/beta fold hydrolase [Acuticoccus yangtzensis]|uniref:alpha/beta fold hydrolase n=1 Tax=Acuticoccus yangtzensis TaxID=1443441 RepID=UPI00094988C5|nr:alpha/beta hydrolase [Acuticoccus yangtzensis]